MINFNLSQFAVLFTLLTFQFAFSKIIQEISLFSKIEIINDQEFIFKKEIKNGIKKEEFLVGDTIVDREEFKKLRREAKLEYIEKLEKRDEEEKSEKESFKNKAKLDVFKKLLSLEINKTKEVIKKLNKYDLSKFLVFSEDIFFSKDYFEVLRDEIFSLEKSMKNEEDIQQFSKSVEKVENFNLKLNKFFQVSVDNAIKNCDDTLLLKNLLEI